MKASAVSTITKSLPIALSVLVNYSLLATLGYINLLKEKNKISLVKMKPDKRGELKEYQQVQDWDILNSMRDLDSIESVKINCYIKFGIQRILKLFSLVPNVTIFAVNSPVRNIHKPTIRVTLKGKIA